MGDTDTKKKREGGDSKKRGGDSDDEEKKLALKVKSYTDIQRFKLDKLMKDPSRPAFIPERRGEKNVNVAPEFNHNIMGSSAGAGSGEFHLYRQMRRKEQNRMKILGEREDRDELNDAYHAKLQENQKMADEKTNKKRKKRMKKKQNQLKKKVMQKKTLLNKLITLKQKITLKLINHLTKKPIILMIQINQLIINNPRRKRDYL